MNAYLIYYESFWEMDREIRWGYWGNVHWAFHRGGFSLVLALILSCLLGKRYSYLISPCLNISDLLISLFSLFCLCSFSILCSSLLFSFHFCLFSSHFCLLSSFLLSVLYSICLFFSLVYPPLSSLLPCYWLWFLSSLLYCSPFVCFCLFSFCTVQMARLFTHLLVFRACLHLVTYCVFFDRIAIRSWKKKTFVNTLILLGLI